MYSYRLNPAIVTQVTSVHAVDFPPPLYYITCMATKVLIVDDDLYIRDLYHELLENAGYEVDIAEDGKVGLTKIMEGGYGVIVLDVMLPLIDGLGILSEMSLHPPKKKNGKVILLTNLANDPLVKEATNNPQVFASLIKADITPDVFVQTVQSALG